MRALHRQLSELVDSVDGAPVSASEVIDGLLDLRQLAEGDVPLVVAIDHALGAVPGETAVPADWWRSTLATIDALIPDEPASLAKLVRMLGADT